jgi:transposase InsO family protein
LDQIPLLHIPLSNWNQTADQNLSDALDHHGIFYSTTSPYNPHQNGIAERSNRTVFDLAMANMHACGSHWNTGHMQSLMW